MVITFFKTAYAIISQPSAAFLEGMCEGFKMNKNNIRKIWKLALRGGLIVGRFIQWYYKSLLFCP